MGGSTFIFWILFLMLGLIVAVILGCINPHISDSDKMTLKKYKNVENFIQVPEIRVSYRFGESLELLSAMVFSTAALISFFIESFSVATAGCGIFGKVLAGFGAVVASWMVTTILTAISLAVEAKQISSIQAKVRREYGIDVIDGDYGWDTY